MRIYVDAELKSVGSIYFLLSKLDRMSNSDLTWVLCKKDSCRLSGHQISLVEFSDAKFSAKCAEHDLNLVTTIYWGGQSTRPELFLLRRDFSLEEFYEVVRRTSIGLPGLPKNELC